jgi:AAHS family 4-hydroxybenzoate transporter-like MFS transporter
VQTKRDIDVQAFLNENRFSGFQWLIFAMCFFIVLLDGFDTAAIGYIAPSLIQEWGVPRPALAPVLSAALFGLAFGALGAGPLADRLGRRIVLIGSVAVFAGACLVSALSQDLQSLTIWRFATGLGLGAAMPNAVTLMSEYCPTQRRSTLTNAMFCGFPVGAAFGGFLAAWMIPHFGWRSVLILGGVAPLVLLAVMILWMPESVRYMVAKGYAAERIRSVLCKISLSARQATSYVMTETKQSVHGKGGLALVLGRQYRVGSLMVWLSYFMGLVIFYALLNWMPILFKDAGIDPRTATLITALFPLGGVGAIFSGYLMDRFNANSVVAVGYVLTAIAVYFIGQAVGNVGLLALVVVVAGVVMNTAQSSMPALAAGFYPTAGRATGVAMMLGIGRFGGIAGSFLVAQLTAMKVGFGQVFLVVAVAGVVAAIALIVKQLAHPETAGEHSASVEQVHRHALEATHGGHLD